MVVLGAILGLLAFLFDPFDGQAELYSAGRIILIFLSSIFLIPYPVMEDRSFNLFGLNAPAWSLFWEYIANIVYAFILYKLRRGYLFLLTIIAGATLCFISYRAGNQLGGWAGENFLDGGGRIAYSFLAGMLIYRSNWIIKNNLGFIGLTILLILAFMMPGSEWNWLTELLVVLFYFPVLISLGAGAVLSTAWKNLCVLSGKISYPLYMTHYAVIWMFGHYYTNNKPGSAELTIIITTGTVLLIAVAYLVMVIYDTPVRKYLNTKRVKG